MKKEDLFIKNLSDYLNLQFTDFDKKRIVGYMNEYVDNLPAPKDLPPITIFKEQVVYRYINECKSKAKDFKIKVAPKDIISIVSKQSGVQQCLMLGKKRDNDIVIARQVAIYLIRKECDKSWKKTAEYFGKDHTTAMYAFNHVEDMLKTGNQNYISLLNKVTPNIYDTIKKIA